MIRTVRLRNFKCFEKKDINLANLTLLTGLNSSGKSTTIQSLLLFNQTILTNRNQVRPELVLNGELISLGGIKDLINKRSDVKFFSIGLNEENQSFEWAFSTNTSEEQNDQLAKVLNFKVNFKNRKRKTFSKKDPSFLIPDNFSNFDIFKRLAELKYIPADRIGPNEIHYIRHANKTNYLGPRAEYALGHLIKRQDSNVSSPLLLNPNKNYTPRIPRQVEAWLSDIFPETQIDIQSILNTNAVTLGIRTSDKNSFHRPQNVGFGISYIIPILSSILTSEPGDLIVIENPEAHLHPKAQSRLTQLIARAASAGIQIIVESHSEHILNGIRLAIAKEKIGADQVIINFYANPNVENSVTEIHLEQDGSLSTWPDGFFDETIKFLQSL